MKTVSMLDFLKDTVRIIRQVQGGQRLVLTYRGKPAVRLEPVTEESVVRDDPFYTLYERADVHSDSLANQEIDEIIYEP